MAQQGTITKPTTGVVQNFVQGTCAATDDWIGLSRFLTRSYVGIQLSGTWTGTVTFEASIDGTNFATVSMTPSNSTTVVTTATGNGVWSVQNTGYAIIRVRFSTASSGTVTVTVKSLPSQF